MLVLNVVRMARLVTPAMRAQGGGAIVNISTFAAYEPDPRFPISSSLRAALGSFCKLYADQEAKHGIRMNNVLPGFIDTRPVNEAIRAGIPAGTLRKDRGDRQDGRVPPLGRCRLHHRPEYSRRWGDHAIRLAVPCRDTLDAYRCFRVRS